MELFTDHDAIDYDELLVHNWRVSQLKRQGFAAALELCGRAGNHRCRAFVVFMSSRCTHLRCSLVCPLRRQATDFDQFEAERLDLGEHTIKRGLVGE
jgi:hypothetical protein